MGRVENQAIDINMGVFNWVIKTPWYVTFCDINILRKIINVSSLHYGVYCTASKLKWDLFFLSLKMRLILIKLTINTVLFLHSDATPAWRKFHSKGIIFLVNFLQRQRCSEQHQRRTRLEHENTTTTTLTKEEESFHVLGSQSSVLER